MIGCEISWLVFSHLEWLSYGMASKLEWFNPGRGVRQGDSISSYLFVLCMERLGHLIHAAVNDGSWKAVRLSRNGPLISHLFFADDLVLFVEASIDQMGKEPRNS